MPPSQAVAARCAALGTSVTEIASELCGFARRVRDARHNVNAIINDLMTIKTGAGIIQDDFSVPNSQLPTPITDAVSQILDSCEDCFERLRKAMLNLSRSRLSRDEWLNPNKGPFVNLRQDLEASRMVLDLAIDYLSLYGQQDTIDSFLKCYVSDLITASDDLLKRTDVNEIEVNLIARDRLLSLLKAIRLLRSCITAMSRDGESGAGSPASARSPATGALPPLPLNVKTAPTAPLPPIPSNAKGPPNAALPPLPTSAATPSSAPAPVRRTTAPRPDSLEPSLGEFRRSGRNSPATQNGTTSSMDKGIGTWLASLPVHEDAQPLRHSRILEMSHGRQHKPRPSAPLTRTVTSPSRGTFFTDDGVSTRTLTIIEPRLKKTRSWCSGITAQYATHSSQRTDQPSIYAPTILGSDVSIMHSNITSDELAVAKQNRKNLGVLQRVAFDRILANIPTDATPLEVEKLLWEGANPMVTHPEYGYFFIRAAYEMSPTILKILVKYGADITKITMSPSGYYSAIHAATIGKQLATIKYLLGHGHLVDIANETGETPLFAALKTSGAYEIASYLIDMGADINHKSKRGDTPFDAVSGSHCQDGRERSRKIELLLCHGADGSVTSDVDRRREDWKGRSVLGLD